MIAKKHARTAFSAGLTVLAAAFLLRSARESGIKWESIGDVSLATAGLVSALFGSAVIVSGLLWAQVLRRVTSRAFSTEDAIWTHVQSWLLKYVPGQVGAVAAKILWGTARQIPRSRIAASFVYENVFFLLASFVVSLPAALLLVEERRGRYGGIIALLAIVQLGILALPRIAGPLVERRSGVSDILLTAATAVRLEVYYLAPRVLNGIGFVLLATSIVDLSGADDVLVVGAVYVLAGTLGTLAFLVPSGLGVREAIITALLAPRIGASEALTLAASARLFATATDVGLLVLFLGVGRRRQKRGEVAAASSSIFTDPIDRTKRERLT